MTEKKEQEKFPKKVYEHIAICKVNFNKFKYLKKYIITRDRPKPTDDDMMECLIEAYEKSVK